MTERSHPTLTDEDVRGAHDVALFHARNLPGLETGLLARYALQLEREREELRTALLDAVSGLEVIGARCREPETDDERRAVAELQRVIGAGRKALRGAKAGGKDG